MKRLLLLLSAIILLGSCEVYVYEEAPVPRPPVVVVDQRDMFTGIFDLEEWSQTFQATKLYEVQIVKSLYADNRIFIRNFYCDGLEVEAFISGNTFVIPEQIIGPYLISGQGQIRGDELYMEYYVNYDDGFAFYEDYATANAFRIYFDPNNEGESKEQATPASNA